ncbi:hypothetical protein NFX46_01400 [Streptomyces phaeoluteigriseus]|uniref:Uncharacterized protein n=1 Tax=Streptomyces phaeoluteigriseus TaxID=114686 RepID=A0ABY4Z0P3_9ACTN|nr:hypothetical protein [Streptomyces phaeoluteigriseus]USQ82540.1 hypothetical protein NFX46_01400 [Streptomyces phaeoluteigriseus]
MKKPLSSRPSCGSSSSSTSPSPPWPPLAIEGSRGVLTAVGMGVVSLGAGVSLVRDRGAEAATR